MSPRVPTLALLTACQGATSDPTTAHGDSAAPEAVVVVSFNTGTTETMAGRSETDGWTEELAATSDRWYGDGLAWLPAVEAAGAWFASTRPDLVTFQEIFWSGSCAEIPEEAHDGFVCDEWRPGDPTVVEQVLGEDYQVACHPGKPDKCAAVHRDFGHFTACDDDFCLEGLEGTSVEGCGSGARVARGHIELVDGGALTLVSVHGTSGASTEDQACRVAQVEQVFVDLGDGSPGADGQRNLVMGDLNTDPGRLADVDESARRWLDFVGTDRLFHFVSEVGAEAPGSYQDLVDIDHVISDVAEGSCWHAGLDDRSPVMDAAYFDHRPVVCELDRAALEEAP